MYGTESAEIYDLLHEKRGKDFRAEAERVAELINARRPEAHSLLDVACGTGAHLRYFESLFKEVAGLELSEAMLALARSRLPTVPLAIGDMRTFGLDRQFDAIACLFGSIGYVGSAEELTATLRRFAHHLVPGGVAVIEPWWFPERFTPGHVAGDVVTVNERTISRVSHARRVADASLMEVHYVVASADTGVRHFQEEHLCRLFTRQQYESAFTAAGFAIEYLPGAPAGRGLFVGVRR